MRDRRTWFQAKPVAVAFTAAMVAGLVAGVLHSQASDGKKTNEHDGLEYVRIPAGEFVMGCSEGDRECKDNEGPAHRVRITREFFLSRTETTVAAYKKYVAATHVVMPSPPEYLSAPLNPGWADSDQPMTNVSWEEAQKYCTWIGGRLPTEAEWEYAARAGSTAPSYGSVDDLGWYADNSGERGLEGGADRKNSGQRLVDNHNHAHAVAKKHPNAFGLYDMLGNASEWVADFYADNAYSPKEETDPKGPATGEQRVFRGGNWSSRPNYLRASYRMGADPDHSSPTWGFRCAW